MSNNTDVSSIFKLKGEERAFCTWARLLLNSGLGGAICIMGIIGNQLSYIVLQHGNNAAPVATFLLRSLALTDNFFLFVWFVNFSLRDLFRYFEYNSVTWRYIRIYSYSTLFVAQCATIWLTVLIAASRYIAVCKPYIARRVCSLANIKLAVLGIYLFVIMYNLPRFFEVELQSVNGSLWITDTWLGSNETYKLIYVQIFYYIFTFGLPLVFLCYLNIRLTVAYQEVAKRRQRMRGVSSRTQQDDANITLVMIVVVAVFVLTQLPGRLVQIIWSYHFSSCRTAPFYIMELSTILEVFNSGVNFVIYSLVRPQFRKSLNVLICRQSTDSVSDSNVGLTGSLNVTGASVTEQKTEVASIAYSNKDNKVSLDNNKPEQTEEEQPLKGN